MVSYTTVSPLPAVRRADNFGGLFSVALSVGSPRLGVTQHFFPVESGLSSASLTACRDRPANSFTRIGNAATYRSVPAPPAEHADSHLPHAVKRSGEAGRVDRHRVPEGLPVITITYGSLPSGRLDRHCEHRTQGADEQRQGRAQHQGHQPGTVAECDDRSEGV